MSKNNENSNDKDKERSKSGELPRRKPRSKSKRGRRQPKNYNNNNNNDQNKQQVNARPRSKSPAPESNLTVNAATPTASSSSVAPSRAQKSPPQPGQQQSAQPAQQQTSPQNDVNDEFKLLLMPPFSAMTRITDNLFLTGVSGMTRENFRKNHIDFVVNITTEAPFWEDIESMRLPLEDDISANILPYLDIAVDKMNEAITRRNAHVLVHCVAGVSRSATIVIAYLMKYHNMNLRKAFNYCYSLRPVVRPNNSFMMQLIHYEFQLYGRTSVQMVQKEIEGVVVNLPSFFIEEHPSLVQLELIRVREQYRLAARAARQVAMQNAMPDLPGGRPTPNTHGAPTPPNSAANNPSPNARDNRAKGGSSESD